jgi:hypothetical protein
MGAPGLAFETWDPCNEFPVDTRLCMSSVRDLRFHFLHREFMREEICEIIKNAS